MNKILITLYALCLGLMACGKAPSAQKLIDEAEIIAICEPKKEGDGRYGIVAIIKGSDKCRDKLYPGLVISLRKIGDPAYKHGDKAVLFIGSQYSNTMSSGRDYSQYEVYEDKVPAFGGMSLAELQRLVAASDRPSGTKAE